MILIIWEASMCVFSVESSNEVTLIYTCVTFSELCSHAGHFAILICLPLRWAYRQLRFVSKQSPSIFYCLLLVLCPCCIHSSVLPVHRALHSVACLFCPLQAPSSVLNVHSHFGICKLMKLDRLTALSTPPLSALYLP